MLFLKFSYRIATFLTSPEVRAKMEPLAGQSVLTVETPADLAVVQTAPSTNNAGLIGGITFSAIFGVLSMLITSMGWAYKTHKWCWKSEEEEEDKSRGTNGEFEDEQSEANSNSDSDFEGSEDYI